MYPITILSFGYLHPWPEDAPTPDITVDLRRLLADPAHVPDGDMLDMTGLDDEVSKFVFATPGAAMIEGDLYPLVARLAFYKTVTVAIGCAGGRHRSVAVAQSLYEALERSGENVSGKHLHVHLPRVIHTP